MTTEVRLSGEEFIDTLGRLASARDRLRHVYLSGRVELAQPTSGMTEEQSRKLRDSLPDIQAEGETLERVFNHLVSAVDAEHIITVASAAKMLRVPESKVWTMIHKGTFRHQHNPQGECSVPFYQVIERLRKNTDDNAKLESVLDLIDQITTE